MSGVKDGFLKKKPPVNYNSDIVLWGKKGGKNFTIPSNIKAKPAVLGPSDYLYMLQNKRK